MKKLLIAVVLAFSLSGCYQMINTYDLQRANKICSKINSEVYEIKSFLTGDELVMCMNGKVENLNMAKDY